VRKPLGRRKFGRTRMRWNNKVRMELRSRMKGSEMA
jgi:hypothetical protein